MKWLALIFLSVSLYAVPGLAQGEPQAHIDGGVFVPFYGDVKSPVQIADFDLDVYPVTNREFLEFVAAHPKWRRTQIPALFADKDYLHHWEGSLQLGPKAPMRSPVTNVSWFAAKAYCRAQDKRLPTQDEWEFAARASEDTIDAFSDKKFTKRILAWYSSPARLPLPEVGHTFKNYWGVWDMHGLVWEWVADFNAVITSGASRKDSSGLDPQLFCAAGSVGSIDPSNYAAFMRYAMLGSVQARYAVQTLGFRCASDTP